MITSLLLTLAVIVASEDDDIWENWNSIIDDTFGEDAFADATETSFTDLLWDQVDFGDATIGTNFAAFSAWLTGIEFNDYLNDTNTKLSNILSMAGDTSGLNTSQIVDAIDNAGFNSTDYGWGSGTLLLDVLNALHDFISELEVLSYIQGTDLSWLSNLDDVESTLTDFGFSDVYTLSDINDFLDTDVEDAIPSSYPAYITDLDGIEDALADIIADDDSGDLGVVLSDMESLLESMQTDVDNGQTDLQDALDKLSLAHDALSVFNEDPTDVLQDLSENLKELFDDTSFDYDGLDTSLGIDWLDQFITAMTDLSGGTYEVCDKDVVKTTIQNEYSSIAVFGVSCLELLAYENEEPDCVCLNGADLYGNPDKEDVVESLECLYDEDDDLTVVQNLNVCNGESVETDDPEVQYFEIMSALLSNLTVDNYANLDTDLDTSELSGAYEDIINSLVDLNNVEIVSDGTNDQYLESVSTWIDKFDTLLSDLDIDGSYPDAGDLQDLVDTAWSSLNDESQEGESGNKMEWWAWLLIGIGVLCVICLICFVQVTRKNRKLHQIAVGIEFEGEGAHNNHGFEPIVDEPIRTGATTAGTGATTAGEVGEHAREIPM